MLRRFMSLLGLISRSQVAFVFSREPKFAFAGHFLVSSPKQVAKWCSGTFSRHDADVATRRVVEEEVVAQR